MQRGTGLHETRAIIGDDIQYFRSSFISTFQSKSLAVDGGHQGGTNSQAKLLAETKHLLLGDAERHAAHKEECGKDVSITLILGRLNLGTDDVHQRPHEEEGVDEQARTPAAFVKSTDGKVTPVASFEGTQK